MCGAGAVCLRKDRTVMLSKIRRELQKHLHAIIGKTLARRGNATANELQTVLR